MQQKTFLTIAAAIALAVGTVAVAVPAALLASKGTLPSAAANLWMREVGVLLVCIGVIAALVRHEILDQVFLPRLTEDHAVHRQRLSQASQPRDVATERQVRHVSFDDSTTRLRVRPVRNKVACIARPCCNRMRKHRSPLIGVAM